MKVRIKQSPFDAEQYVPGKRIAGLVDVGGVPHLGTADGPVVNVGEWVVRGRLETHVVSNEDFERVYEAV